MNLFSRYASASLLLAIAGCSDPAAPISSRLIGDNLIRLSTSASARQVERGSPVTLRATLTNEGTETVTLHFGSGCQILPYIRDFRGNGIIPDGGWFCTAALSQLTLAPGQSEIEEYVWAGSTDFRLGMPLRPVPPGRYYFTAEVGAGEGKLRTAPIELVLK